MRRVFLSRSVLAASLLLVAASIVAALRGFLPGALALWILGFIGLAGAQPLQKLWSTPRVPRGAGAICKAVQGRRRVTILRSELAWWIVPEWGIERATWSVSSPLHALRVRSASVLSMRISFNTLELEFLDELEERRVLRLEALSDPDAMLALLDSNRAKVL